MTLFPQLSIWLVLALAVLLVLTKQKYWPVPLLVALVAAIALDLLDWLAFGAIGSGLLLACFANKASGWRAGCLHLLLVIWALALAAHWLPGFERFAVIEQVKTGPTSSPFSLFLKLDKPMLIFAFILLMPAMLFKRTHAERKRLICLAVAGLLALPFVGVALGLLRVEVSVPDWLMIFALNNLLFTCVAEEVLFRGYLQGLLMRYGNVLAVVVSSLLFGAAHFAGGGAFVLLASLAGACYGLIYLATGRLYFAVLAHFLFNLYHLIFFTYPLAIH